jgi:hypothetical protein
MKEKSGCCVSKIEHIFNFNYIKTAIMKTNAKVTVMTFAFLIGLALLTTSCQKDDKDAATAGDLKTSSTSSASSSDCSCVVNPSDTINLTETDMLIFMREEEKLARDVYTAFQDLYTIPIFKNIAKSEQRHMDQVLCLLQFYGIPDPALPEPGLFINPDLQVLYNDLVAQGSVSLTDALIVGAIIEDKDIFDLEEHLAATSNPAITGIFENLVCASSNHLRSFTGRPSNYGITYTPQFISQEEYDAILSSSSQNCGQE